MGDQSRGGIPFKRVVAEFAIIFLGVSLGLLADDYRQRRIDAEEAIESLAQLSSDLVNDSMEMTRAIEVVAEHSAATALVQRSWPQDQIDPEAVGYALRAYLRIPVVTFRRSAFESLRAGNRLALIEPRSLRATLVAYYDEQELLARQMTAVINEKTKTIDAFSQYVLRPPSSDPTAAWPLEPGPVRLTSAWSEIRKDNVAYNQISYSGSVSEVARASLVAQLERNADLLAQVRSLGR